MGRVNCHTHAAPPHGASAAIAAFVLDPAFANYIAFKNTAPRSSRQPALARGCEAEPAARVTRRGDKRMHRTLPMVRKGETLFHGETNAR